MASSYKKNDDDKILCLKLMLKKQFNSVLCSVLWHRKTVAFCFVLLILLPIVVLSVSLHKNFTNNQLDDASFLQMENFSTATSVQTATINIPTGIKKANPFVPYRNIDSDKELNDVPDFTLVEPPEIVNENSDAARVMDTIVSGILYDRFSPSAILNIEGSDYLVKKGDVVNNYKVLNISQNSVTVQLGHNTYKAGIGEILTEGTLNKNEISNLNRKFGGKKE